MWEAAFVTCFKVTSQYSPGRSEEQHKIHRHGSHFEALFENETSKSSLDGFPAILCYNFSNRMPLTRSDNPLKARGNFNYHMVSHSKILRTFRPHDTFLFFVRIPEQTQIICTTIFNDWFLQRPRVLSGQYELNIYI